MGIMDRFGSGSTQDSPSSIREVRELAETDPGDAIQYTDQCIAALDSSVKDERVAAAWALKDIAFHDPQIVAERFSSVVQQLELGDWNVTRPLMKAVGTASHHVPDDALVEHYSTFSTFVVCNDPVVREWVLIPISRVADREPESVLGLVDTVGEILQFGDRVGKRYAGKILEVIALEDPDLVARYRGALREVWDSEDAGLQEAVLPALTVAWSPPVTDEVPDWLVADLQAALQVENPKLRKQAVEVTGLLVHRHPSVCESLRDTYLETVADTVPGVRDAAGRWWFLIIGDH